MLLAIDPGPVQSAWVLMGGYRPVGFGIEDNEEVRRLSVDGVHPDEVVIEMIASYGMAVGAEVFETCVWIGRFTEIFMNDIEGREIPTAHLYRKDVKMNLCHSMKANDSNIRQALIDRFGVVGTKIAPGHFYGFKKDIWAAYAVGVTYLDLRKEL